MKRISLFIAATTLSIMLSSCGGTKLIMKPTASLELQIKSEEGTNGVAVTYNKNLGKYYAVIAGNESFPLETFNSDGGSSIHSVAVGYDSRGLWYNPTSNKLEGNAYYDYGWYQMGFNSDGTPDGYAENIYYGEDQPEDQSVGAFDWTNNEVLFFDGGSIYRYDHNSSTLLGSYPLMNCPVDWSMINNTTVIYTGYKDLQIGLLDFTNKKVYLFNKADGKYKYTVQLPSSAITNDIFRFSFANNYLWLYDVTSRKWTGYKMFQ